MIIPNYDSRKYVLAKFATYHGCQYPILGCIDNLNFLWCPFWVAVQKIRAWASKPCRSGARSSPKLEGLCYCSFGNIFAAWESVPSMSGKVHLWTSMDLCSCRVPMSSWSSVPCVVIGQLQCVSHGNTLKRYTRVN